MKKNENFDEKLLDEIEDIIDIGKEFHDRRTVPIIYDGRQYTIKIPKKLASRAEISIGDLFEFCTVSRSAEDGLKTELSGRLLRQKDTQRGK